MSKNVKKAVKVENPNVVTSLRVDVEHFPGSVKTAKATIYVTNHKTGESQVIECKNNTEAMRTIAANVMQSDIKMMIEAQKGNHGMPPLPPLDGGFSGGTMGNA